MQCLVITGLMLRANAASSWHCGGACTSSPTCHLSFSPHCWLVACNTNAASPRGRRFSRPHADHAMQCGKQRAGMQEEQSRDIEAQTQELAADSPAKAGAGEGGDKRQRDERRGRRKDESGTAGGEKAEGWNGMVDGAARAPAEGTARKDQNNDKMALGAWGPVGRRDCWVHCGRGRGCAAAAAARPGGAAHGTTTVSCLGAASSSCGGACTAALLSLCMALRCSLSTIALCAGVGQSREL